MSTSGTARMTRAASKARSVASDAGNAVPAASAPPTGPSTPAAAAATPTQGPRSNRGGRFRRAASPAIIETEDKPEVVNKANRAYGTQGRQAKAQQLSTNTMDQGLTSIANVVTNAQAPQNQAPASEGGLTAVVEEEEGEGEAEEEVPPPMPPLIVEAQVVRRFGIFSSLWAPQIEGAPAGSFPLRELRELTAHDRMAGFALTGAASGGNAPVFIPNIPFSEAGVVLKAFLFMVLLLLLWTCLFRPDILVKQAGVLAKNGTHQQLLHAQHLDFANLNTRLGKVEYHLQNLKHGSQAFDPTPKQQVNWFMPGLGAEIDDQLSSPTAATCDQTWNLYPWNFLLGRSCPDLPLSPPSKMALQAWDDPILDRWCAPRSDGKLQLVVNVGRTIAPTELIIEYVSKDAAPAGYMGTAPKEVELWIQVEDDDLRAKISDLIGRMFPDLYEDSLPQGKQLSIAQTLGSDWVPVGRWIYNIYQNEAVQTLNVPFPIAPYGVETKKVAVRVNSNWGDRDFTCINRVRLHGQDTSGIKEALEEDSRATKA